MYPEVSLQDISQNSSQDKSQSGFQNRSQSTSQNKIEMYVQKNSYEKWKKGVNPQRQFPQRQSVKNLVRFSIALGVIFLLLLAFLIAILIFWPLLIIGFNLIIFLAVLGSILFVIFNCLGFVWYLSRKQPELGDSNNYSLDQSRNID